MRKNQKQLRISVGNPLVPGIYRRGDGINIVLHETGDVPCSVVLFDPESKKEVYRIPFRREMIFGHVKAMYIEGMQPEDYNYAFCVNGVITADAYAVSIRGTEKWGEALAEPVIGRVPRRDFDWEGDTPLERPYEDTIIYRLHVRGFTKDSTSKVKKKGTFAGIMEKIPYLKELGITMVELMPAYDFREVQPVQAVSPYAGGANPAPRINFWGYAPGNYFVPKASYAADSEHPSTEFRELVKALHKNGIELCMEFYFQQDVPPNYIMDCLRRWVLDYHVDGLHVSADEVAMRMMEQDPILAHTKLIGWGMRGGPEERVQNRHVASYDPGFMMHARQFLKGDEGQTGIMAEYLYKQPDEKASIHYISNHGTFTLYDLVSYDRKHNEDNGEQNRDGENYNYSWNCGEEGPSKKKRVLTLRMRQIKNALCMLFCGQAVPMLYAGDEWCNSQKGNNNPYCQDNPVGWVNWNQTKFNKEIFEFTKQLIAFRKAHPILHMRRPMEMSDYHAYGLPDLSFHGNTPWYGDFNPVNRHFGLLYCGQYAQLENKPADNDIYLAWNLYWEAQGFELPSPTEQGEWKIAAATDQGAEITENRSLMVPPRSVVILISERGKA